MLVLIFIVVNFTVNVFPSSSQTFNPFDAHQDRLGALRLPATAIITTKSDNHELVSDNEQWRAVKATLSGPFCPGSTDYNTETMCVPTNCCPHMISKYGLNIIDIDSKNILPEKRTALQCRKCYFRCEKLCCYCPIRLTYIGNENNNGLTYSRNFSRGNIFYCCSHCKNDDDCINCCGRIACATFSAGVVIVIILAGCTNMLEAKASDEKVIPRPTRLKLQKISRSISESETKTVLPHFSKSLKQPMRMI
jgi:hypothetical protein